MTSPSISYSTTSGTFVTNTVWSLSGTTPENSVSGSTFDRSSAWACSNVGTGWYTYGGDTVAYYITSCLAAQKSSVTVRRQLFHQGLVIQKVQHPMVLLQVHLVELIQLMVKAEVTGMYQLVLHHRH